MRTTIRLMFSENCYDPHLWTHSKRVAVFATALAQKLHCSEDDCKKVRLAGLLHDVGKVGLPDFIIHGSQNLSLVELKIIQTHPARTFEMLSQLGLTGIFADVPAIAAAHHEALDGTGYPNHLNGDEIPYLSKIITVADVFEAMTADRCYHKGVSAKDALEYMKGAVGIKFDQQIFEVFASTISL